MPGFEMKKIATIGCDRSSMSSRHALMSQGGYDVALFSEKTSEQWRKGSPTGTPFLAGESIDIKREASLVGGSEGNFVGRWSVKFAMMRLIT